MAGSVLRVVNPNTGQQHDLLLGKNAANQHTLQAIYRQTDNKNLAVILQELETGSSSVLAERVVVSVDGQRVIDLTQFQIDISKDVLLVTLQGLEVFEGTTLDYVKTSATSITFNYDLSEDEEVYVLVLGTLSAESFGDDIYNALSQFRQLVDTPASYLGKGGKYVRVNEGESGLEFDSAQASNDIVKYTETYTLNVGESIEEYISFAHKGRIKAIRVTPTEGYVGSFQFSLKEEQGGQWIYHSGIVENVLWDIMEIPFIDVTGNDYVYLKLLNSGPQTNFIVNIFTLQ